MHGEEEAEKAQSAARALFVAGGDSEHMPTAALPAEALTEAGVGAIDLLLATGLVASRGEARRVIEQGGLTVDDARIGDWRATVEKSAFDKGYVVVRKGKKSFCKVTL